MSERQIRRERARQVGPGGRRRTGRRRKLAASAGTALGATIALTPAAEAATFPVINLEDSGAGSLRDAIEQANATTAADVITFQSGLTGTITLTTGEIEIDEPLEIQGPGSGVIAVSGDGSDRIFFAQGADGDEIALTISGLTLTDGDSTQGGAIRSQNVALTIRDSVLTGNDSGGDGGALYNTNGALTLERSVVSNNVTDDKGGGLHAEDNDVGDIVISNSVITGNSADDGGGVMLYDISRDPNASGSQDHGVLIHNTTVSDNDASDEGGGIYVDNIYYDTASIVIDSTTVAGNTVSGQGTGGGITFEEELDADGIVRNSTISGNSADEYGGGIYFYGPGDGSLTIQNSTVSANSADSSGGGLFVHQDPVTASSTIVANNAAPDGDLGQDPGENGSFELGFSLIENTGDSDTTESPAGSNIFGVDPLLGLLQSNGGPTQTHAPAANSPALDKGIANGLATDQRGLARTQELSAIANATGGDGTDIGSVELQAADCQGQGALKLDGSGGDDTLTGTDGPDAIAGLAGNDTADAGAGNDCVSGDDGNDSAKGGAGADLVNGGAGKDKVSGGGGKDKVKGQAGKDKLKGGGGKDRLSGAGGKDKLSGGGGKDRLKGGPGKDKLTGGGGKDRFNCGGGKDKVTAQAKDKVSASCEKIVEKG